MSLLLIDFKISTNFQSDAHKREKELVKEAAEFLVTQQIPAFVSITLFE